MLCVHLVTVRSACGRGPKSLADRTAFNGCDELAHQACRAVEGGYSWRRVINTIAARSTPNAWKPVLIWPNAMLSKVVAAVAAPISSGIGRFRCFDFKVEDADVTVGIFPLFRDGPHSEEEDGSSLRCAQFQAGPVGVGCGARQDRLQKRCRRRRSKAARRRRLGRRNRLDDRAPD